MKYILRDEQGTAIVAALLILLMLTFVALTATDTTVNEKTMIRNEAIFEQNFSLAESAALEGLQKLASMDNDDIADLLPSRISSTSTNKDLLVGSDSEEMKDIFDLLDSTSDGIIDKDDYYAASPSFEKSNIGAETYRTALLLPIANGDSLSTTTARSRLYRYDTIGLSEDGGGKSMILIGYKRRIEH
nr:hypothetical protein [uncultured Desulfobulbus sp.]